MPNRCSKAGHPVEVEPAQPEAFFFVCSFDQDVVWDWLFLSGALNLSDLSQSVVGPFGVIRLCRKALGMPIALGLQNWPIKQLVIAFVRVSCYCEKK